MKKAWKPILFATLNSLSFLVSLAILLGHLDLYTGKQKDPLGLLIIIPADVVFVVIGVGLFILGGRFHISMPNKLLPFMAALGFLAALFLESEYARPKLLFGLSMGVVICLLTAVTTVQTLISSSMKAESTGK
jgi:hypothetical protein